MHRDWLPCSQVAVRLLCWLWPWLVGAGRGAVLRWGGGGHMNGSHSLCPCGHGHLHLGPVYESPRGEAVGVNEAFLWGTPDLLTPHISSWALSLVNWSTSWLLPMGEPHGPAVPPRFTPRCGCVPAAIAPSVLFPSLRAADGQPSAGEGGRHFSGAGASSPTRDSFLDRTLPALGAGWVLGSQPRSGSSQSSAAGRRHFRWEEG